ncbi:PLP-dependent transferase [Hanseniaspora valbyensis NRRL Y-1626]|uniref:PLP-dependent transferase n=1 Tax=Hanseniaspora valbyensis NRRL Y-1626 TaxID=766949 RepID=A0A1B7TDG5_9ASCO|nr:PLP-dependent transferase [Hanseniaspora valbyensis NRRL Y-1626]
MSETSYVFQSVVAKKPAHVLGGKGCRITVRKDGKVYEDVIDAVTGAAVGALGWGDEDVGKYMAEVLPTHTYTFPAVIGNQHSEDLAKFYIEHSPKGAFASALWCCSGSEANENALKITKQYWLEKGKPKKNKFISRDTSYHGFSLGALSISENARADDFTDILIDQKQCVKMPVCFPYRYQKEGQSEEEYTQYLLDALEKLIIDNDPETVASVIVETLPGSSLGTVPPPKGYLPGIRKLCDKYDVLLHLDEVMCGTGRSNPNGGLNCWENYLEPGQFPDIQTVGKTLGSGYVTIAGVLVGPKIKEAYENGSGTVVGSHTYSSHGFNCGVALRIQQKIMREGLTKNIFEKGNLMGKKLTEAFADKHNIVGDVRGIGGFWTVEFVKDKKTKEVFDKKLDVGHKIQDVFFEKGLNVMGMQGCVSNRSGLGDFVLLAPSFVITEADVDEIVKRFVEGVEEYEQILKDGKHWE